MRQARLVMELRARGISNNAVLRAIERVPRDAFLPAPLAPYAYDDRVLPLPCGQQTLTPFALARMFELLRPLPADRILLVGLGLGYSAAVLGQLFRRVFAMERYRQLLLTAEATLKAQGAGNVVTRLGDGLEGWEDELPFDAVLLTAGVEEIPAALIEQSRRPGRIVFARMRNGARGQLCRLTLPKTGDDEMETFEDVAISPAIPGCAKAL